MCLAIPGKVESINNDSGLSRMGKIRFGEILREVSLALVPKAQVGDYVIVHAGFALNILDEKEAKTLIADLASIDQA